MSLNLTNRLAKLACAACAGWVPALAARLADLMAEAARQRPDLAAARSQVDSAVRSALYSLGGS